MKSLLFIWIILNFTFSSKAQQNTCTFKDPVATIQFGSGFVQDINSEYLSNYVRLRTYCPPDGYYSYSPYTSRCFSDDWHTLTEDHTPGDVDGNMMLVNGAANPGIFLQTTISGLKGGTTYELGLWLMNLCRPTDKCPFPLLPNLVIRLSTPEGKVISTIVTGDLPRVEVPHWTQHRAMFTTPGNISDLRLSMMDNTPGGCGNDFVLDDITIRECIKKPLVAPTAKATTTKTTAPKPSAEKKQPGSVKTAAKKIIPAPIEKEAKVSQVSKPQSGSASSSIVVITDKKTIFPPPPLVLTTRANPLVKRIETEAGEIKIELYDNGEIDGDTVSIYHNNVLIKAHARLSEKPISFSIPIDASQPHHELIMVADNLGSIPPNTSVMIITAGSSRYEVFISSTEQKNAKVIFDLKK